MTSTTRGNVPAEPESARPVSPEGSVQHVAVVRARLLAFFDRHGRALPWREDRDGYRVWVSEIMLQQTRVDAVVPYYERWMRRFPTLDALADAPAEDVLKAWEGLGYYSRARNLHDAARVVRERHGGRLPGEYDALRALPGIGDYTAGAIASIVHHRPEPAVDGNVRRVLARLYDCDLEGRALRDAAAALVPTDRPGDFNQALMELGATLCTPRAPRCDACPIGDVCVARARGTQLERPARKKKAPVPTFDVAVAVLRDAAGRVLLVRRPDRGLLAGMWELPGAHVGLGEDPADAALRAARTVAPTAVRALERDEPMAVISHAFSHRIERYHAFLVAGPLRLRPSRRRVWHDAAARDGVPLPRAQQRLLAAYTSIAPGPKPLCGGG